MEGIGEETKELNYNQFCLLLNENIGSNPSKFTNLLKERQMTGAIRFFDELKETDGDLMKTFEDEPLE
jgi:hypothetical protein